MTQRYNSPPFLRGIALALGLIISMPGLIAMARVADPDAARLFRERIEPVLKAECFACHSAGAKKLRGGLRLDGKRIRSCMIDTDLSSSSGVIVWPFCGTALRTTSRPPWRSRPSVGFL